LSLRTIESRIAVITEELPRMNRAQLTQTRRELDELESDAAGFRTLNSKPARIIENRIMSARITLLSKIAIAARQADIEATKRVVVEAPSLLFTPSG
jgi:hypothetical protein